MIIPNLVVSDMARAVAFYRDVLSMACTMAVTADRQVTTDGSADAAVFVTMAWNGAQLMLQSRASLDEELPGQEFCAPAGIIYLRGMDPDAVSPPAGSVVKGPLLQWYGMRELYLRDPDGHILCLGRPA